MLNMKYAQITSARASFSVFNIIGLIEESDLFPGYCVWFLPSSGHNQNHQHLHNPAKDKRWSIHLWCNTQNHDKYIVFT